MKISPTPDRLVYFVVICLSLAALLLVAIAPAVLLNANSVYQGF